MFHITNSALAVTLRKSPHVHLQSEHGNVAVAWLAENSAYAFHVHYQRVGGSVSNIPIAVLGRL